MTAKTQDGFPGQGEIEGYWDWDKIHAPRPLTPLAGDAIVMSMAEGFTIAQHAFGSPLALRCRMVNNYLYATFCPDESFPVQSDQDVERYVQELVRIAARTGERWVNEWEPSLLPILHRARTADFLAMGDDELAEELEAQFKNVIYYWTIHGWINLSLVPATALMEFYNAEMQPDDQNEAWLLLQGYPTKSVETSKGLWRLSDRSRTAQHLRASSSRLSLPGCLQPSTKQTKDASFLLTCGPFSTTSVGGVTASTRSPTSPGAKT